VIFIVTHYFSACSSVLHNNVVNKFYSLGTKTGFTDYYFLIVPTDRGPDTSSLENLIRILSTFYNYAFLYLGNRQGQSEEGDEKSDSKGGVFRGKTYHQIGQSTIPYSCKGNARGKIS
jgi:hypothetical protein